VQTVDFRHFELIAGDRVLDLGCGEGCHVISAYLCPGVEAVGVDLSLDDLATTREKFEEYAADTRTVDAVERCLARISEAAVRLGGDGPRLCPDVPWADIRGLGNHLRHAYETIDQRIVWRVATREVAPLERGCAGALERLGADDA